MRQKLKRLGNIYHYTRGNRVPGPPPDVDGDLTGVRGDLTDVYGDLTDIRGDLTDVYGNLTGVRGDLTGVFGDLDKCDITESDRSAGIDIADLIAD